MIALNFPAVKSYTSKNREVLAQTPEVAALRDFLKSSFKGSSFGKYKTDVAADALVKAADGHAMADDELKTLVVVLYNLKDVFRGSYINGLDIAKTVDAVLEHLVP